MAVTKSDITFYLTNSTLITSAPAAKPESSLGGYVTPTTIADPHFMFSPLSVTSLTLNVFEPGSGLMMLDSEIVEHTGTTITKRGSKGTTVRPHSNFDFGFGYALTKNNVFNSSFNDSFKQYRCIAIKNEHETDTFYGLKFYLKSPSRNPNMTVRIAVEMPRTNYLAGTVYLPAATTGGSLAFVGLGLAGVYSDNHFKDCILTFTSGTNLNIKRLIASYDGATGTFVLDTALGHAVVNGNTFNVDPSPSQVISSGTVSPVFSGRTSALSNASTSTAAIGINVNGARTNGANLAPNEVVYLWFERTAAHNADKFDDNWFIFTANYKTS